ncbi:MAG: carboxylating nicotinate-nucleotide diphosphorylase [Myxococcota bacterium]
MLFISPRIQRLIDMAIDEDEVGFDVASAVFFEANETEARLVAKEPLTVAGLAMVEAVYDRVDASVDTNFEVSDGDQLELGDQLGTVTGPKISLLRGERIALNFLQRMCGIATATRGYANALADSDTRIVDTRKTLPGYRELDKYAVRCGGGSNHRFNLSGGVMIKDNHIAAAGSIAVAVERARERAPLTLKIEVETTTLDEVRAAIEADADIIMLDNMSTDEMIECIDIIRDAAGDRITIEASGNITAERLPEIAHIGLDYVSSGALTHSVRAADISMRMG